VSRILWFLISCHLCHRPAFWCSSCYKRELILTDYFDNYQPYYFFSSTKFMIPIRKFLFEYIKSSFIYCQFCVPRWLFLFKRCWFNIYFYFCTTQFRNIFNFQKHSDRRGTTHTHFLRAPGCMSLRSSCQCAVDHTLLSSVEIMKKRSGTTFPHITPWRAKRQFHLHV